MSAEESFPLPTRADRLALHILQLGAVACAVAVTTFHSFELDRFFIPKELVLHLTAFLAGGLTLPRLARTRLPRHAVLLLLWLGLSALSAAFATNGWLAARALGISVSSVVLFLVARRLGEVGLARPLGNALAFAVTLAAISSLLQTYGVDIELFSRNRIPGGTLGNRNFVAHAAAFGWPMVLLAALRARGAMSYLFWSIAAAALTGSLVLTRSRAAWLAFGGMAAVLVLAVLFSASLRRSARFWVRLAGVAVFAWLGVAAAIALPNTLRWRSDNPYLESVQRMTDYERGSGRGRLIQYRRSLAMSIRNPLLGVGPGNWPVEYPAHVPPSDPSLDDSEPGMTSNPWPSSDWVAFAAERGWAALAVLVLALLSIAAGAFRQLGRAIDADEALVAAALLATGAGAVLAGTFDAVLLLPFPAIVVWPAVGALGAGPDVSSGRAAAGPYSGERAGAERDVMPEESIGRAAARPYPAGGSGRRALVLAILVLASGAAALRSGAQIAAMETYTTRSDRASLAQAAAIDPGNYRVRLRLARMGPRARRCEHARAAHALYPYARAAAAAARECGGR